MARLFNTVMAPSSTMFTRLLGKMDRFRIAFAQNIWVEVSTTGDSDTSVTMIPSEKVLPGRDDRLISAFRQTTCVSSDMQLFKMECRAGKAPSVTSRDWLGSSKERRQRPIAALCLVSAHGLPASSNKAFKTPCSIIF